ncbi:hypothetical protein [Roseibium sp. RKSG952]|uniref:hypothetical protein n=1 Tax=Roseibium sp. RKSG952 TaxID=2529384 RepID=UPI0012BC372F|nr:hypothetical protein [Roseibium sp. RKSG952]MTI01859.1 hypothetical protein [Roseibium sp. RKSG952]
MERKIRHVFTALTALTFLNVAAYAAETEPGEARNLLDVAHEICVPEFKTVFQFDEGFQDFLANELGQKYPLVSAEQHLAFDKYVIGSVINAKQLGDMTAYIDALKNGKTISDTTREKSSALLSLVECLRITTDDEKRLAEFIDVGVEAGNLPSHVNVESLLSAQNSAECMYTIEAGRRVLAVDASAADVSDQVQFILEDTAGRCEKDF